MNITQQTQTEPSRKSQRGTALIFAISLLALFGFLGTIFLKNMTIHLDQANLVVDDLRASNLATAGVQSAIADLAHAIQNNTAAALITDPTTYEFPTYTHLVTATPEDEGDTRQLGPPNELRTASATVTITKVDATASAHRYRILSTSSFSKVLDGQTLPGTHGTVEAIIQFHTNNDYEILHWNTQASTE